MDYFPQVRRIAYEGPCTAAGGNQPPLATLAAGGNGSSQFKRRVLRLVEIDDRPRMRLSPSGALFLAVAAVLLFATPSLIRAVTQPTHEPAGASSGENQGDEANRAEGAAKDLYGDPVPAGAILRLGTIRLRHGNIVAGVAFSPNGQTLATTAAFDPEIRLWEVRTGRLIRAFRGPAGDTLRIATFSPNGARLAAVCSRGGVKLWDVASGLEVLETSEVHDRQGINRLVFAPDGRHFVTASGEGAIRLWDADNSGRQRLLFQLQFGPRDVGQNPLAISPDGKLLAIGAGRNIHFYDLEKGVETGKVAKVDGDQIMSLAFGPDGKTLFSAGDSRYRRVPGKPNSVECDPRLRMWDVTTRKLIREFTDPASERGACAAALSRDGGTLASMESNSIRLWDVASGKVLRTIPNFWLPSAAADKTIHIRWAFGGTGFALSPDATLVACKTHSLHAVTLWDAATGQRKLDFPEAHFGPVEGLACLQDGSRIATAGGDDGTVRVWDGASGKALRTFVIGDAYPCGARSVAFSPDGKSVLAAGPNYKDERHTGIVRIWDVDSGNVRLELRPGTDVANAALSHDGSTLAIATSDFQEFFFDKSGRQAPQQRTLLLVDAKTGAERRQIKLGGFPKCVAFSADGKSVSVVGEEGVISTWDVATGKLMHRSAAGRRLMSAAISQDGTLAAVSCLRTDQATLWDLADGKQIGQVALENEDNMWSALAISPDKRLLASASLGAEDRAPEKHSIRLWDLHSGRLLKRFERPLGNRVKSMDFTPDGRRLISGMSDGTCLVWDVSKL